MVDAAATFFDPVQYTDPQNGGENGDECVQVDAVLPCWLFLPAEPCQSTNNGSQRARADQESQYLLPPCEQSC